MKIALACVPLAISVILAVAALAAGIPKVGDPIENVYADLEKIHHSDGVRMIWEVCPGVTGDSIFHRSFYGPPGATVDQATAGEFDIVGQPHPFAVATYPADSDTVTKLYVAGADGKIVKITDDPESTPLCSLL